MLVPVLLTASGCLAASALFGYIATRWAWRTGYQDGVADMQLALENSLRQHLRKEPPS